MDEASQQQMSLLEQLRKKRIDRDFFPDTFYPKVRLKLELIFKHKSEFPSKLRPSITAAAAAASSGNEDLKKKDLEEVLSRLELEWKRFFSGRDRPDGEWHGVDSNVDTEDQVELALRMFPEILNEFKEMEPSMIGPLVTPQLALTTSIKAISFVPLFMKLTCKFQGANWMFNHYRHEILKGEVLRLLLCNSYPRHAFSWKTSPELDQAALAVLMRMRKELRVACWAQNCWVEYGYLNWLFRKEEKYIKPRVRFLYYWNSDQADVSNWLRYFYLEILEKKKRLELAKIEDPIDLSIFDLVIELRMLRFPRHVAELFNYFEDACMLFGDERAFETFYEKFCMFLKLYSITSVKKRKRDGNNYKDNETPFCYNVVVLQFRNDKETVLCHGEEIALDSLFQILRSDPVRFLNLEQTA